MMLPSGFRMSTARNAVPAAPASMLANAAKSLIGEARADAVSSIARNQDTTAAHTTGAMKTNHGGAVSAAAQKR
ncbi:MAG: hypothetical protein QOH92_894 [Chloroflexota bacterium]|jgi:hypothetical protein|nr:hypothetical protein [Chloroflexota bacterium]